MSQVKKTAKKKARASTVRNRKTRRALLHAKKHLRQDLVDDDDLAKDGEDSDSGSAVSDDDEGDNVQRRRSTSGARRSRTASSSTRRNDVADDVAASKKAARKRSTRRPRTARAQKRTVSFPKFYFDKSAVDDDDDESDSSSDEGDDESRRGTSSGSPPPRLNTISCDGLFTTPSQISDSTSSNARNDADGSHPTAAETKKNDSKRDEVPLPWIVSEGASTCNAFQMRDQEVNHIRRQREGAQALRQLHLTRHGFLATNHPTSTVAAENDRAVAEQFDQFERGVQSIQAVNESNRLQERGDSAAADDENGPDDITMAELYSSILRQRECGVENSTVRTDRDIVHVPVRERYLEELYLRPPYYEGERACVNGDKCQGNFVCDDGFTLVRYDALAAKEDADGAYPGMCVICSRKAVSDKFVKCASENSTYIEDKHPDVLPAYRNLIGPGQYTVHQTHALQIGNLAYPVVVHCNMHYRRSQMRVEGDGDVIPVFVQDLPNEPHSPFRDGRT